MGGADTLGYARAVEVRDFIFPADHGPHPDFRTEWWYLTGNLDGPEGRRIGYQLTLFRSAVAPSPPEVASAWGTNQAWMGHFALTDAAGGRFHAFDRFARGAVGLAGAEARPFRVWLEDWTLEAVEGSGDAFPMRLRADEGEVGLDLVMEPAKPRVLQGEEGLSQKGPEPGNASYYYAYTRLATRGTVRLGEETLPVTGLSWMDREWSTSALSEGQVGWDWFALQLDDGWDLMIYQIRGEDGSPDPLSDGVLIGPDGARTPLTWGDDVTLEVLDEWRSPVDGSAYPSGWRIRIPERGWDLRVEPALEDQELNLAFRYWEGAVDVTGETARGPVSGRGYVELTGYAGERPER
jgi:predicted secreted hydrolase